MLSEAIKEFVEKHQEEDAHQLLLSKQVLQGDDLKLAIQQIDGRQRIQHKLPSWYNNPDIVYPIHLSLEQCSSELTAHYKAELLEGDTLVDLTGGFGVDTTFFSQRFKQVVYVERDKTLAQISKVNFAAFGLTNILVKNSSAEEVLAQMPPVDTIFVDPARRSKSGGKVVSIADCTPNLLALEDLLLEKAERILVKMSPMLDIKLALRELNQIKEVHVVAVQNECKELLLLLDSSQQLAISPLVYCINLKTNGESEVFSFTLEEEQEVEASYSSSVQQYLYEPNVALLKAGAYKTLSARYQVQKLHVNSHLYTSNQLISHFPGRKFLVEKVYGLDKRSLKQLRQEVSVANLSVRNFPTTVANLRKKLRIAEGGQTYLFATTLHTGDKAIISCSKV